MPIYLDAYVHPFACVDKTVTIGNRTKVWQFASVIRGTVLGEDCTVAAGACLDGPIFGNRCIISPNVDIGPGFIIGDDVFIGPQCTLCNDAFPRTHKEGYDYEALRNGTAICVVIKNGASLGVGVTVLPGIVIGENAFVGAHTLVTEDVPDNVMLTRDGKMKPVRDNSTRMRTVHADHLHATMGRQQSV